MSSPIQSFSFKGATLIAGSVLGLNLIVVPLFTALGLSQQLATILVNGFLSSSCIAYISVYVDGNRQRRTFIKRTILLGLLFAVTAYMWSNNIYI